MRNQISRAFFGLAAFSSFLLLAACGAQIPDGVDESASQQLRGARAEPAIGHDVSPPLFLMRPAGPPAIENEEHEVKPIPRPHASQHPAAPVHDPVLQATYATPRLMPAPIASFDGVGDGFTGPQGTFSVNSAPPDTNGDVGPNHYVQLVNSELAIWNKSGTAVYGPVALNTIWSGFGGGCQTNNDGDPVVIYDPIADRWVISQFSVSTTPYLQCVAVSKTADPTGQYNRYSFSYGNTDFPDYPKMGVWPDAYYTTFNIFANMSTFSGSRICAYDRAKMLAGAAATQQCFNTSSSIGGLLPADLDGARQPAAGTPNYAVALGASANQLAFYKFHVDWATPSHSTFTGPTNLATAAYSEACGGSTCIPQSGTSQQLDSLADRLMFRLAYRNMGSYETMVVSHAITAGSSTGIRWYELRVAGGTPSIFQQGTYAPDSGYRWMPSIAMDQQGNVALGFSLSSSSLKPQIHYTGRLVGDAAGTMPQGENSLINGGGVQTGSSLSRWGDYSMMGVDPTDDCTFWYTTEYLATNGAFNWHTRIGSFKFPGCGGTATNDFSIQATPASASASPGGTATYTVTTAVTAGSAQAVSLSVSGLPTGATASFSPASITGAGSSTLTVNVGTSVAAGTYALTITGTGASATHTASVSLVVSATSAFTVAVSPTSGSVQRGAALTATVSVTITGSPGTVALTASGLPSGVTAAFSPGSLTASGNSTLTLTASSSATLGAATVTITGTAGSVTHTATFALTVVTPPASDFTLALSPGSGTVTAGGSITTTATVTWTGTAASTSLSATGMPTGVTAAFSPATLPGSGTSTLTLTAASTAAAATATVVVKGTSGTLSHTANFALTVLAAGSGLVNGGFESGLTGWTSAGVTAVSTSVHSGSGAAMVGSTSPSTDSSLTQTFTLPSNATTLSFWYKMTCPDTVTYDWATATLKDNVSGTTTTPLAKVCATNSSWVQATASVSASAGHSVTLTLASHDDNYSGDASYALYDDVAIGTGTPPSGGITNGTFETGSLSGWTSTGTAAALTGNAHAGTWSARTGSTAATNGDSTIVQTFTAPTGTTKLSLYAKIVCPDTVTYDWATVTLKDNTAGTTATPLAKTCSNGGAWQNITGTVTAGHSYTLTLLSHDDNYSSDPTYVIWDDVALQ